MTQQLTARLEQVKALRGHAEAGTDDAVQAADQSQKPWQAMRADLAAKMRDLHGRIERQQGEAKADVAGDDAIFAEDVAVEALDYASWAVRQAELAVLDGIGAWGSS